MNIHTQCKFNCRWPQSSRHTRSLDQFYIHLTVTLRYINKALQSSLSRIGTAAQIRLPLHPDLATLATRRPCPVPRRKSTLMSVAIRESLNCLRFPSRYETVSRAQLSKQHTGDSIRPASLDHRCVCILSYRCTAR